MGTGGYRIGGSEKGDHKGETADSGLPCPQNHKFQYLLEISFIFRAILRS